MDLRLSPDQNLLRASVREFAEREIRPHVMAWDEAQGFPHSLVTKMAELGLMGIQFPESVGGAAMSALDYCICIEELARVCPAVSLSVAAHNGLCSAHLHMFGNEAQKQKYLIPLIKGETLGAWGLTEAGSGSDAGAMRTTAVRDGNGWVINGSKQFITNSGTDITRLVTVTAVTGSDGDRREISAILVPVPTPGFVAEPAYNKVGWNASDTHPLSFTDVRVPEENLLGERGRGYANFLQILDEGRVAIAALATGAAQGCVDESVKYARERTAFGTVIGRFQAIEFKIARMEARAHAARAAYYDAAALMLAGKPFKKQAAIAKLVASEAAMDNARDATQIHGGYGFINEFPVARHYRDSKILEIGEGTSEVQLMLIAREIGLR